MNGNFCERKRADLSKLYGFVSSPKGQADLHLKPSSLQSGQVPRLAPPVDIVSRQHNTTRRRPNPNTSPSKSHQNSYPTFSPSKSSTSQEVRDLSTATIPNNYLRIPKTPNLEPTMGQTSTSANPARPMPTQRTPSQNAMMEKDAIETLLFMSSPENSGYHPNSQQTQQSERSFNSFPTLSSVSMSTEISSNPTMETNMNKNSPPPSHLSRKVSSAEDEKNGTNAGSYTHQAGANRVGLEHQAGDEIDRMLDAMGDSDSEDDWYRPYVSAGKEHSHFGKMGPIPNNKQP